MQWMILPFRRYAELHGRSRRMEYWMFGLFNLLMSMLLDFLDAALGLGDHHGSLAYASSDGHSGGLLSGLYSLVILVPTIAVGVRRLHDIDRTGWWLLAPIAAAIVGLVLMIPSFFDAGGVAMGVGMGAATVAMLLVAATGILLLVWACFDGTKGPNRFGPDPKGGADELTRRFVDGRRSHARVEQQGSWKYVATGNLR